MLGVPQNENRNREKPMKDLKIEYADGQLIAFDIDGQSQLGKALQGISFTHEQGANPVLKTTIADQVIAPELQPEAAQDGELLPAHTHDQPSPHRKNRGPRNRRQ